jgi:hypothetical protein
MAFSPVELSGFGTGFGTIPIEVVFGGFEAIEYLPYLPIFATSASGYEVSETLSLPAGAVLTKALFEVAGRPPAFQTPVGGIATVRASSGPASSASSELVVDFGVLRTVSSVSAPKDIAYVVGWQGTRFELGVAEGSSSYLEFTEVQTERLLIGLESPVSPSDMAEDGKVTTSTPPADLELLVAGARAWTRPGPTPEGFSEQVDVTAALQTAVDAATPDADGNISVPVTLRARVPGDLQLGLAQPLAYLRTHAVAFGGPTVRSFPEEGELELPLPLPDASGWTVHRVLVTLAATDDDPQRVLPPVGPARSSLAELVLDPDRRVVVHVPAGRFAPFEELAGIRVAVQPQAGGVELTGTAIADAEGLAEGEPPRPGEPVPDAAFTPVTLDAADELAFVTLAFPQPLKIVPGAALWFSLAATRGSTAVALAAEGEGTDAATLRRVMPNGAVREPSSVVGVRTDLLQLRVVGIPSPLAPIEIVTVDLVGDKTDRETVTDPELAATGLVPLALKPPAPRPGLALKLTATAATTVTVSSVVVVYAEPSTGGSP